MMTEMSGDRGPSPPARVDAESLASRSHVGLSASPSANPTGSDNGPYFTVDNDDVIESN